MLDSIEDKDSRFFSGEQFHLMVPASFPFSRFVFIGANRIF